jgi:Uma2 family endonuclease
MIVFTEVLESDRPLTYEDLKGFPDDGHRYELLQGELVVSHTPDGAHQTVLIRLASQLERAVNDSKFGTAIMGPFEVRMSEGDVVRPDLFAFSLTQYAQYDDEVFVGAPAFMIEITSPQSVKYDRVRKAALYGESGVLEYWIVEPASKRILVHLRGTDEPMPRIVVEGTLSSAVIPAFSVNLDALFAPVLNSFE